MWRRPLSTQKSWSLRDVWLQNKLHWWQSSAMWMTSTPSHVRTSHFEEENLLLCRLRKPPKMQCHKSFTLYRGLIRNRLVIDLKSNFVLPIPECSNQKLSFDSNILLDLFSNFSSRRKKLWWKLDCFEIQFFLFPCFASSLLGERKTFSPTEKAFCQLIFTPDAR